MKCLREAMKNSRLLNFAQIKSIIMKLSKFRDIITFTGSVSVSAASGISNSSVYIATFNPRLFKRMGGINTMTKIFD